jgi:hypothetical protein
MAMRSTGQRRIQALCLFIPGVFFQLFVGDGGETAMPACFSVHHTFRHTPIFS